jgi:NAD(P)-dependent dehydrogenase (short-subunit alcohol dehydrogenase family)
VTGSSRHLGAAIARRLAAGGATVAVHHHTGAEEAHALVDELRTSTGRRHVAVGGDVTVPAAVRQLVAEASDALGGIDVLVNNAGPYGTTPFVDMTEREWDRVVDANLRATWIATREVAPGMRAAGWGRVVNLSAVSAWVRNRSVYGLVKSAVTTLTEELALELGPEVTVNAVAPGQILESLDELAAHDTDWAARVLERTPAGRLVTRGEVAEVVAQFCTPAWDMVTGVTVPVDGGLRLNRF